MFFFFCFCFFLLSQKTGFDISWKLSPMDCNYYEISSPVPGKNRIIIICLLSAEQAFGRLVAVAEWEKVSEIDMHIYRPSLSDGFIPEFSLVKKPRSICTCCKTRGVNFSETFFFSMGFSSVASEYFLKYITFGLDIILGTLQYGFILWI